MFQLLKIDSEMEQNPSAVKWFVDKLIDLDYTKYDLLLIPNTIKYAEKLEKKRMIAFANEFAHAVMGGCLLTADEFYVETFESE